MGSANKGLGGDHSIVRGEGGRFCPRLANPLTVPRGVPPLPPAGGGGGGVGLAVAAPILYRAYERARGETPEVMSVAEAGRSA